MENRNASPVATRGAYFILGLCILAAIGLALERGIWLDEGYSYWFAGHDLPFFDALLTRWWRDGHPPLFNAYLWLMQPIAGASIKTFRLANLGALALVAWTWQRARHQADDAPFRLLFAVLVAATPLSLLYFAELRSYFFVIVSTSCLIIQLPVLENIKEGDPIDGILVLQIAVTTAFAVCMHYVNSVIPICIISAEAAGLCVTGRKGSAYLLVAIALLCVAFLAVYVSVECCAAERQLHRHCQRLGRGVLAVRARLFV